MKFYNNLSEPGIREDKKEGTLSPGTIRKCHAVLSSMFSKAVKWQLLTSNPAANVDPPKLEQKEMACFDENTAALMLLALEREPLKYQTLIKLAIVTGLRRGELMALQWKYVDLEKGVIQVKYSLQYIPGEGMTLKEPKNKSSLRSVSIPPSMVTLLKEHRKQQLDDQAKAGTVWQKSDYVFTQEDGQLMHIDSITKWFPLFLKAHNEKIRNDKTIQDKQKEKLYLPIVNFHGLRHTAATLLIDKGLNIKAVSARLGHAQTSTTTNIYAHALQSADRQAADLMEDIFTGASDRAKKKA